MLLAIGPFIDQSITQQWVLNYGWTRPAVQQLALSCGLAVLVNISQFMCLGRFSAVSFQVRQLGEALCVALVRAFCLCVGLTTASEDTDKDVK
jgi:solute carrier family 35 protein E3